MTAATVAPLIKGGREGGRESVRLRAQVQEFISATVVPLIQGYGLTETCGGGTVQARPRPHRPRRALFSLSGRERQRYFLS